MQRNQEVVYKAPSSRLTMGWGNMLENLHQQHAISLQG